MAAKNCNSEAECRPLQHARRKMILPVAMPLRVEAGKVFVSLEEASYMRKMACIRDEAIVCVDLAESYGRNSPLLPLYVISTLLS